MPSLTHRLLLLARWPVIGGLFVAVLAFNLLIFPGLFRWMQQLSPDVLPPLDVHLSWSAAEGHAWARSLGDARPVALLMSLLVDMIYPLVYGLLLILLYLRYLPWVLPAHWSKGYRLAWLPMLAVWADWLENLCIAGMAWHAPDYPEWLGDWAAAFTWLKWRLVIGLIALLLVLMIAGLWKRSRAGAG